MPVCLYEHRLFICNDIFPVGTYASAIHTYIAWTASSSQGPPVVGTLTYLNATGTKISISGSIGKSDKQTDGNPQDTDAFAFIDPATGFAYMLITYEMDTSGRSNHTYLYQTPGPYSLTSSAVLTDLNDYNNLVRSVVLWYHPPPPQTK